MENPQEYVCYMTDELLSEKLRFNYVFVIVNTTTVRLILNKHTLFEESNLKTKQIRIFIKVYVSPATRVA